MVNFAVGFFSSCIIHNLNSIVRVKALENMRLSQYAMLVFVVLVYSCSYTKKLNNGQTAYDSKRYALAIDFFEEEFESEKNQERKARIALLMGRSYHFMNQNSNALRWFQKSVSISYQNPALSEMAFALKREERYKDAYETFQKIQKKYGRDPLVERELNICKQAQQWLILPKGMTVELSSFGGNSEYSDYSPSFYGDEFIVFSSDRYGDRSKDQYEWTGNAFSDLYIQSEKGGEVRYFDQTINSDANDATLVFTQDLNEAYFTRCFSDNEDQEDQYCKIMKSQRVNDSWSEPAVVSFENEFTNYGHPALIESDSVMVFTVKDPDGSETYDLYYSERVEDGWSMAFPMPESINTDGNEKFPTADQDTIYFSSDYLPGLGGLDIFKTYLRSNGSWSPPQNLRAPYNSGADDFGLIIKKNNKRKDVLKEGYFTSSRDEAQNDQIFKFVTKSVTEKEDEIAEDSLEVPTDFDVYLAIRVVYNEYQNPNDPTSKVISKKALINANVIIENLEIDEELTTDSQGRVIQKIEKDSDYVLTVRKKDYLNATKKVSSKNVTPKKGENSFTINVEIALDKLELDKEFVMENIYYDFDKSNIREESKPSLNRLKEILDSNPQLKVELASHTDCQGNDAYNQDLSYRRAKAAVNYMISKGINSNRLRAKGFGELKLLEKCECTECTEEQHQANRRTTFKLSLF